MWYNNKERAPWPRCWVIEHTRLDSSTRTPRIAPFQVRLHSSVLGHKIFRDVGMHGDSAYWCEQLSEKTLNESLIDKKMEKETGMPLLVNDRPEVTLWRWVGGRFMESHGTCSSRVQKQTCFECTNIWNLPQFYSMIPLQPSIPIYNITAIANHCNYIFPIIQLPFGC